MKTLMLLLAAIASAQAQPPVGKPADGQKLYAAKCASCHGKDLKGSAPMAKMFKVAPAALNLLSPETAKKTDAELTKAVAEGRGKMPAYKAKLKESEIAAVIAHIRAPAPAPKADAKK